ncbi:hypothetical protein TNCV_1015071 [Trichonephila clavipes]|uniref:Uncharacterized protein n=1 Tax=Trichonephila clavipes TaxID=2585209 RepID=A0A8X6VXY4_TRICX|nr:hypothetical protein TNCV_1015071 [Trichonephila clavipes]
MALYRSPLTLTLWPSSFLKKYGPMIPPAHKAHQTSAAAFLEELSQIPTLKTTCGNRVRLKNGARELKRAKGQASTTKRVANGGRKEVVEARR